MEEEGAGACSLSMPFLSKLEGISPKEAPGLWKGMVDGGDEEKERMDSLQIPGLFILGCHG